MFYSDTEISVMAKGHGEDLRYTRERCAEKRKKNSKESGFSLHRAAAALIALFRF